MAFWHDTGPAPTALRRISRFAAVGLLGTIIDIALFTFLHVAGGVPALAANTISY